MKGKKSYPVSVKCKDTVASAAKARKSGGRCVTENKSAHSPKDHGTIGGDGSAKHGGKSARGVHGKPLFSAAK